MQKAANTPPSMIGGRLLAYLGLLIPFALLLSHQTTPTVDTNPLSSIEWVAYMLLLVWFLFGGLVAYGDIAAAVRWYRRRSALPASLPTQTTFTPPPTAQQPRSAMFEALSAPPGHDDLLDTLMAQPAPQPLRPYRRPPPSYFAEGYGAQQALEAEPPQECAPEEPAAETLPAVEESPSEAPAAGPAVISSAGKNPTHDAATDPTLPWPIRWSPAMMTALAEKYARVNCVPMLIGLTRMTADGTPVPDGAVAPLIHRMFPGSVMAALIAGSSDSGKSVLMNVMLLSAASFVSPSRWRFSVVELDSNALNFQLAGRLPHCRDVVTTAAGVIKLYREVKGEHQRRASLFVEATRQSGQQIDDIGAYNTWAAQRALPQLPIWTVAIDELRTFMKVFQDSEDRALKAAGPDLVEHIAYGMRKTGIGPIYATQYPLKEVLPRIARTQIASPVISFRLADPIQRRVVFGEADIPYRPEDLPIIDPDPENKRYAGRAVISLGGNYYVGQVPTFAAGQREEIVSTLIARYPVEPKAPDPASTRPRDTLFEL